MKLIPCVLSLLAAAAVASAQDGAGVQRALLIGINKYQSPLRAALGGCVNDVNAVEHVLTTRFGFAPQNVHKLTDGEATRAAILRALELVVSQSQPNDVLYIHYAGHGAYVKDLNDDEGDGIDETICPVDSLTEGVPDIVDDEIDMRLQKLRTPHAIVVFDSCHSGTATRAPRAAVQQRGGVGDTRLELYKHLEVKTRGGAESKHVFLSAVDARQTALDGPIEGVVRGFFSRALTDVLSSASTQAPLEELWKLIGQKYARVQQQAAAHFETRTPRLEATEDRLRRSLFPSKSSSRLPYLTTRGSGATILLVNGAANGAAIGSMWAVYPEGETHFAPGFALAIGVVVRHRRQDAVLQLQRMGKKRVSFENGRAILQAPALTQKKVSIKIHARSDRRKALAQAVAAAVPDIEIVDSAPTVGAQYVVEFHGDGYRLMGGDEQSVIVNLRGEQEIAKVIARSVLGSELATLENPASALVVQVSLADREELATRVGTRGLVELVAENASAAEYLVDDPTLSVKERLRNAVTLRVEAEQDCYLTAVGLDQVGRIQLGFPTEASERLGYLPGGFVEAYSQVELPKWTVTRDGSRAPSAWVMDAVGDQHFHVFATSDLATAERIRDVVRSIDLAQQSGGADLEQVREMIAGLRGELLGSALGDPTERGIVVVVDSAPDRPDELQAETETETAEGEEEEVSIEAGFGTDTPWPETETVESPGVVGDWTVASVTVRVVPR